MAKNNTLIVAPILTIEFALLFLWNFGNFPFKNLDIFLIVNFIISVFTSAYLKAVCNNMSFVKQAIFIFILNVILLVAYTFFVWLIIASNLDYLEPGGQFAYQIIITVCFLFLFAIMHIVTSFLYKWCI